MKLKSSNTYESLYHLALRWARADENNFDYDEFIQSFNMAINRITAIILKHDNGWKWADRNSNADLIDASTALVSGQSAYPLSAPWLKIARVRIKSQDGKAWQTLEHKDRRAISDYDLSSETPRYYSILGGSLYVSGAPSYSQSNGLEVQFQGGPVHFTPQDENEEVGFSPLFEELGALMPALDYLQINGPNDTAQQVATRIGIEPRQGQEGSGLLNELALTYQERYDGGANITLKKDTSHHSLLYGGMSNPGY